MDIFEERNRDSALKDKLYIFAMLTIVGVILSFSGEALYGPGVAVTGAFAFITELVPVLVKKYKQKNALRDIEAATIRKGDFVVATILKHLEKAREIDFLGNVLNDIFGGERRVLEILKKREDASSVRIRICIYKPDKNNPILSQRASDEASTRTSEEQLEHLIASGHNVSQTVRSLRKTYGNNIELRYISNTYILNSIIRVDNKMVVVDYLHQTGTNTPVFVFRAGGVQNAYKSEFQRLWEKAEPVDFSV